MNQYSQGRRCPAGSHIPVQYSIQKLVGEDFFAAAAARYIHDYPSRSGNLQDYGERFPDFLAMKPEAASLAYLPDVARLAWARQESYLAADAGPLDLASPAEVRGERITEPRPRLPLHPSTRLVQSAHPLWDIWMFCQQTAPEKLDLSGVGQAVLIWCDTRQLAMQQLEPGQNACIAGGLDPCHRLGPRAGRRFEL